MRIIRCRVSIKYVGIAEVYEILNIQAVENKSEEDLLNINCDLDYKTFECVKNVIRENYSEVEPAPTSAINLELSLVLKEPHTPYSAKLRRFSIEEKLAVERIVDNLLEKGHYTK